MSDRVAVRASTHHSYHSLLITAPSGTICLCSYREHHQPRRFARLLPRSRDFPSLIQKSAQRETRPRPISRSITIAHNSVKGRLHTGARSPHCKNGNSLISAGPGSSIPTRRSRRDKWLPCRPEPSESGHLISVALFTSSTKTESLALPTALCQSMPSEVRNDS